MGEAWLPGLASGHFPSARGRPVELFPNSRHRVREMATCRRVSVLLPAGTAVALLPNSSPAACRTSADHQVRLGQKESIVKMAGFDFLGSIQAFLSGIWEILAGFLSLIFGLIQP